MSDPTSGPPSSLRLEPGVDFHPAPLITRTLVYFLDLAASALITLALYRFFGLLLLSGLSGNTFLANTLSQSMFFIGGLGYWVVVPLATGATPAKMLFRMRIVPESNKSLSPTQVILREVIGQAATVLTLGLGFLLASRDPRLRGLNDRLAGTRLIQFKSPRPELYRIQDLCTVDKEGTLQSEAAGVMEIPGAESAASVDADTEETAAEKTAGSSLYTRPTGETAYERRIRAARGPTIEELGTALHRTAEMVAEGQLMQKVLDRKREDFVQKIKTADLGDPPTNAVSIIVELGKEGHLTRGELEEVRDILRRRLSSQAPQDQP